MSGLDDFLAAIAQVESGGNYSAHNPSGALGKYQVMAGNVPGWTKRALGYSETPDQFLHDPAAQEAVARTILGGYYQQYGPEGAAAMWFSGQPNPNSTASDGGNTVRQYVNKVLAAMRGGSASTQPAQPAGVDLTFGLGGAINRVTETVKNVVLISPFVVGGVVLVVVGLAHATGADAKAKQKAGAVKQRAEQAAVTAAMA
jgi:Transglycosylase SLT domain